MKASILFFSPSYTTGGVEKVLINLANEFDELNYPISYLVCQNIGELKKQLNPAIQTYSLNKRLSKSLLGAIRFFKKFNVQVVICGPQFLNILTVLVIKFILKKNVYLIVTHHSFHDLDVKKTFFMSNFSQPLIKFFYGYSDKIVAVSNAVKSYLTKDVGLSNHCISVIYNPAINKNFEGMINESVSHKWLLNNKKHKVLIYVGRLSKVKNLKGLINLMPEVIAKADCKLIIIGDGEEKGILKEMVNSSNLQQYIDFIGIVDNPIKYIAASDLLILPSISETFSLVAVEAIASGTPVLSTPTTGVVEILRECQGCYFEDIENENQFRLKILEILGNKKLVDKAFVEKFSVTKITKDYEALIHSNALMLDKK